MTDGEFAAIKARCEAATPGPWFPSQRQAAVQAGSRGDWWAPPQAENETQGIKDATFIAKARTDIPALIAEVERLRAEVEAQPRVLVADHIGTVNL